MANLRDDPFVTRPNSFGDAAAAANNPGVVVREAPMTAQQSKVFGLQGTFDGSAAPTKTPAAGAFDNIRTSVAPGAPAAVPPPAAPNGAGWTAQQLGQRPVVATPADPSFHGDGRYGAPPNPTAGAPAGSPPTNPAAGGLMPSIRNFGAAVLPAAGPLAAAAAEGPDVAKVVRNPNATPIDVASQVAQGTGRAAAATAGGIGGAQLGASIGALGGPLAPITVPAGAVLGGLAGGWAGYKSADMAIEGGRKMAGVDPRSPAEVAAAPAAPASVAAPTSSIPDYTNDTPAPPSPPPTTLTRLGNAYSDGSAMPGDLTPAQRAALGVQNDGVGIVSTSTKGLDTPEQMQAWRNAAGAAEASRRGGLGIIDPSQQRQEFFDGATLRSAAAKGSWSPRKGYQGDEGAVAAAMAPIAQRQRLREIGITADASMENSRTGADAVRYASENRLAGDRAQANATLGAASLRNSFDLQQRAINAAAFRAAGGDPVKAASIAAANGGDAKQFNDMAGAAQQRTASTQTVQDKAIDNTRNALRQFGPDGKVDEQKSAAAYDMVNKILPGFSNMSEAEREKAMPHAQALAGIFGKVADGRQMGFAKLDPTNPRAPEMTSLPDFKGGKLVRQGLVGGALTPGGSVNGFFVRDAKGVEHPLGDLSDKQQELIERNIKTGKWGRDE
ncbi:MAG: hypothetical protein JSS14_21790 [Proteobacteria bacterium]|nr:hypothetical protein [Pseudomonadota bacterium]